MLLSKVEGRAEFFPEFNQSERCLPAMTVGGMQTFTIFASFSYFFDDFTVVLLSCVCFTSLSGIILY